LINVKGAFRTHISLFVRGFTILLVESDQTREEEQRQKDQRQGESDASTDEACAGQADTVM